MTRSSLDAREGAGKRLCVERLRHLDGWAPLETRSKWLFSYKWDLIGPTFMVDLRSRLTETQFFAKKDKQLYISESFVNSRGIC